MGQALFVIVLSVVTTALLERLGASWRLNRTRAHNWRVAVERAGLTGVVSGDATSVPPFALTGFAGTLRVRLSHSTEHGKKSGTVVTIDGLGHGQEALTLRREGFLRQALSTEIELGAPAFDDALHVQGDRALALAVLDAQTRRQVVALLHGSLAVAGRDPIPIEAQLTGGVLTARLTNNDLRDGDLGRALEGLLALAQRLAAPPDLARRLAENLRREPAEGVRLQTLRVLTEEFPDHPATREALDTARKDPSDEVRLRAAQQLGREGTATLLALAENPGTDDGCAARAVAALGGLLKVETAATTLRHALQWQRHHTAQACLETLGRFGGDEDLLLQGLASDVQDVAAAAAEALGRRGTAAAVMPLREIEAKAPAGPLGAAARKAIAAIQSRLAGADHGQLTLTDGVEGALSLPAAEPGQLSFDPVESEALARLHREDAVPDERAPECDPCGPSRTAEPA